MMKLRQRRWIIWSRPVHGDSPDGGKVMFTGEPYAPALRTGQPVRTTNTKGMEKNSNVPIQNGCYFQWYATTSFTKLKEKYKELLATQGAEHILITEEIPMDTIIYPQA